MAEENTDDPQTRFELYVKKSSTNGGPRGSCPFSLKVNRDLILYLPFSKGHFGWGLFISPI